MKLTAATSLIEAGIDTLTPYQIWADLGAGNGFFTTALGQLIGDEGIIYAVDKDEYALNEIETSRQLATIIPLVKDFATDDIGISHLHGVLMANSLHFIEDKKAFITRISPLLQRCGRMIIIEYDTSQPNQWVPYPIAFSTLEILSQEMGFNTIQKLGEQPSRFSLGSIYSALLLRC